MKPTWACFTVSHRPGRFISATHRAYSNARRALLAEATNARGYTWARSGDASCMSDSDCNYAAPYLSRALPAMADWASQTVDYSTHTAVILKQIRLENSHRVESTPTCHLLLVRRRIAYQQQQLCPRPRGSLVLFRATGSTPKSQSSRHVIGT